MLGANLIQVWRLVLEPERWSMDEIAAWQRVLSEEELGRANMFRREDLQRNYVATHAALRLLLGRVVGISPKDLRFVKEDSGAAAGGGGSRTKPALLADLGSSLKFNLSHTRGAALICLAIGFEVGVDIEFDRPLDDLDGMAAAVMSRAELRKWKRLGHEERQGAFYNLWTRKESYLKAIGLGLYRDLHEVTVPVSAERPGPRVDCRFEAAAVVDEEGNGSWLVADLPVSDGYAAAACYDGTRGSNPEIEVLDFDLRTAFDRFGG